MARKIFEAPTKTRSALSICCRKLMTSGARKLDRNPNFFQQNTHLHVVMFVVCAQTPLVSIFLWQICSPVVGVAVPPCPHPGSTAWRSPRSSHRGLRDVTARGPSPSGRRFTLSRCRRGWSAGSVRRRLKNKSQWRHVRRFRGRI